MKTWLFASLLFTSSQFIFAQTDVKAWTLEQCINHAMENNITIKSASLSKNSAEVTLKQSQYQRLPNLSGSASQSLTNGTSIDPITSDYVQQQIQSTNMGLNTQMSLYNGGQLQNQIKQNELYVEQADYFLEQSKNNIVLSITEAFIRSLFNKESIRIAENNLASSAQELEMAKARYEAGAVPIKDYMDAQSQLATNQYNLISAKNNYNQQLITLKQLLELQPEVNFDVLLPNTIQDVNNIIPDRIAIYQEALNARPEIQANNTAIAINERALQIAKGAYLPSLTLSGGLATGYTSTRDMVIAEQFRFNFNQRVSLGLNVPIFNRLATKSQVERAKINIDQAKINLTTAEKDLYNRIETAWLSAVSAKDQMNSAEVARESAATAYNIAKNQFDLGAINTTNLVIAKNFLINSEQNYIQAKFLFILYSKLLDFYQGNKITLD